MMKMKFQQTLISGDETGEEEGGGRKGPGFYSCYLLTSLCPRFKGHTYIGYTLNPRRRIRQHNGEIGSGACRTKKMRPWEMVFCIYGFPTNTAALKFEWAWQNPIESLAVRKAAATFKSLSGLRNQIKLAYTMLTLPNWNSLNLTVNLFSTKYQHYTAGCPPLPEQMRTRVCSMDDLPCYNVDENWDDNECERANDDSGSEENLPEEINHKDNDESSGCVAEPSEGLSKKSPLITEEDQGLSSFMISGSPTRKSLSFASSSYIVEDIQSPMVVKKQWATSMVSDKDLFEEEDQVLSSLMTSGSPIRKSSSFASSSFYIVEDIQSPMMVKKQGAISDKDVVWIKNSGIVSHEVEVIDIFTPSPCHVVSSGGKKKRARLSSEENLPEEINHKDNDESSGCVAEPSEGLSKKSPLISEGEDQVLSSFTTSGSPIRRSLSFASSSYIVEDIQSPVMVKKQGAISDKDLVWIENRGIINREVEVIDVFTPSHYNVVSSGGKKRRARLSSEIIDLTNSPLFV